jgi:flagellar motor switch protein FliG
MVMSEKTIVLTMYGKGDSITEISIGLFDEKSYHNTSAEYYCLNLNDLDLKNDDWIYSSIVDENRKIVLEKPLNRKMLIFSELDNRGIQKVLRKIDARTLAKALTNIDATIKNRIMENMSKTATKMLEEDIECLGPAKPEDVKSAQQQIVSVINHMEDHGEIVMIGKV